MRTCPNWHWIAQCTTLRTIHVCFGINDEELDKFYMNDLYANREFWKGLIKAVAASKHLKSITINGLKCPRLVKKEIAQAVQNHQLDHLERFRINDWTDDQDTS